MKEATPIKVAVVDDHHLFRQGIIPLINNLKGIEVVMEASDGKALLDQLEQTGRQAVHLVLLDLEMPGMDGLETIKAIKARYPEIEIVMLSAHEQEMTILRLVELGAKGYMLKNAKIDEVETAIRSVMQNGFYFNDRISNLVLHGLVDKRHLQGRFNPEVVFTPKERQILELTCKEYTNAEIAKMLFVSQRTVEGHRQNMLEKIGARSKVGLVVYALEHKLVDLRSDA